MRTFRKVITLTVVSSLFGSLAFAGPDAVEMTVQLDDSATTNQEVLVVKHADSREFYLCNVVSEKIARSTCTTLTQFSVRKFNIDKNKLNDGKTFSKQSKWRIGLTSAGAVLGIFPSAFVATMTGKSVENGDSSTLGFIVAEVLITGASYLIGSWLDGKHFSALQTASIMGTIGRTEILDENADSKISVPVTVADFKSMLEISSRVLNKN